MNEIITGKNQLISIIVPVYNVAEYLPRCMDSILCQTHKELEILLINDGSTDTSGAICDKYAGIDNRVRVIHQKNGGVSKARNAGLDVANGTWIGFVDPDDAIKPNMYDALLKSAVESKKQCSVCGMVEYHTDGSQAMHIAEQISNPTLTEESLVYVLKNIYLRSVANKLFHRSLIIDNNPVRFDANIHAGEDMLFVVQAFTLANGAAYVPEALYCYFRRENSASFCFNKNKLSVVLALDRIIQALESKFPLALRYAKEYRMDVVIFLLADAYRRKATEFIPKLQKELKARYAINYLLSQTVSFRYKCRWVVLVLSPRLSVGMMDRLKIR